MILQALLAYAERDGLGDADFVPAGVRWQISLTADGRLAGGPIPLSDDPTAKKPPAKTLRRPFTSPNELTQTGDKARAYFLCDSLERATLYLDPKTPEKHDNRRAQHRYFRSLLLTAAEAAPSIAPTLRTVLTFLDDPAALAALHADLGSAKAKPNENCTFAVDGIDLLTLPALHDFWRQRRRAEAGKKPKKGAKVCLATGELGDALSTHEKIKGIPGGKLMDRNLISFNKECPSFESLGLEQAQNAPLSASAELKIRTALNTLVQHARDQRLVFNETVYLHWTREPIDYDPLALLTTADPDGVAHLLQSIRQGQHQVGLDTNAYYCLGLSGNGARIVVRDWLETTPEQIQQSVASWFSDIELIESDGSRLKPGFSLGQILWALANPKLRNPYEILPANAGESLLRGALTGAPIPQPLLAAALRRERVDRVSRDEETNKPVPVLPARLALIKIILNRTPNQPTMTPELNTTSSDRPYLCGRLLAVFERLQYLAQGRRNSGVVDRFYAAASTTPALVMPRLFRNAEVAHLPNAGNGLEIELSSEQKRAIAENVRRDFEGITTRLGCEFPPTLTLEEQGRFALGFYHQKADYRRISAENRAEREAAATAST